MSARAAHPCHQIMLHLFPGAKLDRDPKGVSSSSAPETTANSVAELHAYAVS